MNSDRLEPELIDADVPGPEPEISVEVASKLSSRKLPFIILAVIVGTFAWLTSTGEEAGPSADEDTAEEQPNPSSTTGRQPTIEPGAERLDAVRAAQAIPPSLLAAELFTSDPTGDGLRDLFDAIGGFEGLQIAEAEGAFDLVRFNPLAPGQLLASHRLSYGEAENQDRNEIWQLQSGDVEQTLWAPTVSHDFVHFNIDGTATMWTHGGGSGFAPRTAVSLDRDLTPLHRSEPMYASRFTAAGGTVFALTGNGDYYASGDRHVDLLADDGTVQTVLDDASRFAWIDNPSSDLLVAYPRAGEGFTAVWDAASLLPLPFHPLAARPYQRVAVATDAPVAVGVRFDGAMEVVDLESGRVGESFGEAAIVGVDQPITLNRDGTIAVTIESTGHVTLWWVGDDTPIARFTADEAQPRWLSEAYAPTSASAVAPDASLVALRTAARPEIPVTWVMIDTDVDAWVRRACELAGRVLTDQELDALGLPPFQRACDR